MVLALIGLIGLFALGLPEPPLPYTTTMLRTHHYADGSYLSISEELSSRQLGNGSVTAINIAPPFSFDINERPKPPRVVSRIRVVIKDDGDTIEQWYFVYSVSGEKQCLSHKVIRKPDTHFKFSGFQTVRGIEAKQYTDAGAGITRYFAENEGYYFPFRDNVTLPSGSSEIGYVLDYGSNYLVSDSSLDGWFDTSGCSS